MEASVRMVNKEGKVGYFTEKTANSAILARAGWVRQEVTQKVTVTDETEPTTTVTTTGTQAKPKRTAARKKSTKPKRK